MSIKNWRKFGKEVVKEAITSVASEMLTDLYKRAVKTVKRIRLKDESPEDNKTAPDPSDGT